MGRLIVLSAALLFGLQPAAGQDAGRRIALIGAIVNGLADDGEVIIGSLGKGAVRRASDTSFEVFFPGPSLATFVFAEEPACVFTATVTMAAAQTSVITFDMNRVSAVTFTDRGQYQGLTSVTLGLEGGEGVVQLIDKGVRIPMPGAASIVTSMSIAELDAAAAELRAEACPGVTP